MKEKMTAKEIMEAKKQMEVLAYAPNREQLIAETIRDVYDPEMPVNDIIEKIGFEIRRADVGEHVNYNSPRSNDKKVLELSANCNVSHVKRTPASRTELSFVNAVSEDYYVCIMDLLSGDHNALKEAGEDIIEALNRYELYAVLQLIDAAAVANGNVFTLDSGDTRLNIPKLYAMKKAIRKYGQKLVLVTGTNVTEDVDLLDYNADKNREQSVMSIVDEHIPVESLDVYVGGVSKDVIDDDVAYLVAVSDSKKNKPGIFARRKMSDSVISKALDTQIVNKERAIIFTGSNKSVDALDKFALGYAGVQQYGAVIINSNPIAKFTRS